MQSIKPILKDYLEYVLGQSFKKYRYSDRLKNIFLSYNISNLVDVGANEGQFVLDNIKTVLENKIKVFSFEPSPMAFSVLSAYSNEQNICWETYNYALGEKEESLLLNVSTGKGEASSFLSSNHILYNEAFECKINSFDSIYKNLVFNKGNVLVKIDVQGYHINVINGMIKFMLEYSPIFIIETALLENTFYTGSPSFSQLLNIMIKHDYFPVWIQHNIVDLSRDFEYDVCFLPGKLIQHDSF